MSGFISRTLPAIVLVVNATAVVAQTVQPLSPAVDYEQRATLMHERASALQSHPRHLLDAARLHRTAAKLRKPEDPRAFECLTLASYLMVYAGRPGDARYVLEEAAWLALRRGDVHQAARAYVEAAFIAERQRKPNDIRKYADQAKLLANSPAVTDAQRQDILARLAYPLAAANVK